MDDVERVVRRAALEDAVRRDGTARWDIVLDRVKAESLSDRADQELKAQVRLVVARVNDLDEDDQREQLAEIDPRAETGGDTELLDG